MSRLKKEERQVQLKNKINKTPFITDEELAAFFEVSVPTIRLDRLKMGIPELRERIKAMAKQHSQEDESIEIIGELIDLEPGKQGISILKTTVEMIDSSGFVDPQYLYAQAYSLARVTIDTPIATAGVGNIKYKLPIKDGCKLVAKAEVVRQRGKKYFVWVFIKDKDRDKEIFRAKFIIESLGSEGV